MNRLGCWCVFLVLAAVPAVGAEPDRSEPKKKSETPAKKALEEKKATAEKKAKPAAVDWDEVGRKSVAPPLPQKLHAPKRDETKPQVETERDIVYQLDRRISVDYIESELQDIIRDIASKTGVNMIIDSGVEREKKITLQVKEMPVYKVLRWVMDLSGYHMVYKNEAVLITDRTDRKLITMVYPIADLIRPAKSHYPPGIEDDDDEDEEEDIGDSREKLLEVVRKVVETEEDK